MDRIRRSTSLFTRTLLSFLASLTVLLALLVGVALTGIGWSTKRWTEAQSSDASSHLESLVLDSYRARGVLDAAGIAEATLPYLTGSMYLFVFSPDGSVVFAWRLGERMDQSAGTDPGEGRNFLRRHAGEATASELRIGDQVIGSIAAGVISFAQDAANAGFLRTLGLIAGIGTGISFLLAVAVAFLFSSRLSSHASRLSGGIARLAAGERSVVFGSAGARELALIGKSAAALQEQLVQEQRLRTQWAADVSHDLRTPLAALRAQLEAMTDGVLPVTPDRLARASAELSRVERLVADLGELSRIESPGMTLRKEKLEAGDILQDIGDLFQLEADRRGIALRINAEHDLAFEADRHLLLRALTNVVQNAIQYASGDRGVTVEMKRSAASVVRVRVENSGSIAAQDVPRVFDRLYRGEKSRSAPGSGLGLTIAKAVLDLHGGSLSISATDRGTVLVEMLLPAG